MRNGEDEPARSGRADRAGESDRLPDADPPWDSGEASASWDPAEPGGAAGPRVRPGVALLLLLAFVVSAFLCCVAAGRATGLLDIDFDQLWRP